MESSLVVGRGLSKRGLVVFLGRPGGLFGVGVRGGVEGNGFFDGSGAWWADWVGVGIYLFWVHLIGVRGWIREEVSAGSSVGAQWMGG